MINFWSKVLTRHNEMQSGRPMPSAQGVDEGIGRAREGNDEKITHARKNAADKLLGVLG